MSFKKNQPVKFRTRVDRPQMSGKVKSTYSTIRGNFVVIKGDDGKERAVRPACITA